MFFALGAPHRALFLNCDGVSCLYRFFSVIAMKITQLRRAHSKTHSYFKYRQILRRRSARTSAPPLAYSGVDRKRLNIMCTTQHQSSPTQKQIWPPKRVKY